LNEQHPSDPKYRPGDIVNGHVLNADGTQWLPLESGSAHLVGNDSTWDDASGVSDDTINAVIGSAVFRSYIYLGIATVAGLIGAVTFARANAQGGVVWTGGGFVALGFLYAAFKRNIAAVRASKVMSETSPLVARRSLLPFVGAFLGAILAIGAVAWVVWFSTSSLAVGDCLTVGLSKTECSSGVVGWRVTQEVSDPENCPVGATGDSYYIESNGRYFCIRMDAGT